MTTPAARDSEVPASLLVLGYATTGAAVVEALAGPGRSIVVLDDEPTQLPDAASLPDGVRAAPIPAAEELAQLLATSDLVVASPGVRPGHRVIELARTLRREVISEIELASRVARVPVVAVTGTNGKTTVTELIAEMLCAGGLEAVAAGNIGRPLLPVALERSSGIIVAEVSSAQLAMTERFHAHVAVWLNLSEDHLDWHATFEEYAAAKARIFANQVAGDVAIVPSDDRRIELLAPGPPVRRITFGERGADFLEADGWLVGPGPTRIISVDSLSRSLPHDRRNALAASAAALVLGASPEACATVLRRYRVQAHRVELVGSVGGVQYYDDSKATSPAAVCAALDAFTSVVLIAGGRNKGLDLGVIARHVLPEVSRSGDAQASAAPTHGRPCCELRGVVAIGEATQEVVAAFEHHVVVQIATTMEQAVELASRLASPGDVVLLSPGCASFDAYRSYAERGEDFARCVRRLSERAGQEASVAEPATGALDRARREGDDGDHE